jgi:hypothetical protein
MEEVDTVQLVALASAGVAIPKSVKSARDFTPEALHGVLVSSLRIIAPVQAEGESKENVTKQQDGDDGMDPAELAAIALAVKALPDKLPGNVAVRHRVATAVSNVIRQLGFAGEGGYNQLLYPAERDVRRLLSWVLQKLPRADDGLGGGAMDPARAKLFKNLEVWLLAPAQPRSNEPNVTSNDAAELINAEFSSWKSSSANATANKNNRSLLDSITASLRAASSASSQPSQDGSFMLPLSQPESLLKAYSTDGTTVISADTLRSSSLPTLEQVSQSLREPGGSHINIPLRRGVPNVFPGSLLASYPSSFQRRAAFTVELVIRKAAEKRDLAAEAAAAAAAAAEKDAAPRIKTEEEILREREEEVEKLQADADALQATVEALSSRCQMLSAMLPQLRAQQNQLQQSTVEIERAYLLRKGGLEMLPDAGRNIDRLTAEIEGAASRLLELGAEWEKHRLPLVSSIAEEELRLQNQEERAETKVARVKEMKQQIAEMGANYSAKEELEKRLTIEYAKVQQMMAAASNGGGEGESGSEAIVTRPVYTRRILDVVRQIRKQKSEIGRIVGDVRKVNAELAAVSEKVKKNAASATEMIDRAASLNAKDPAYRQALKQVIALQDAFNAMLKAVSDAGAAENEMRDIENRIEQMQQRNDEERSKEIERDTASIAEENKAMTAQLGGK